MLRRLFGAWAFVCISTILFTVSLLFADTAPTRLGGRPKFSEGKALGYFVWKDGDTWKLRWMTFGAEHRFSGSIRVEGGAIQSLKRIDVDTERKVIRPGRAPRIVRRAGSSGLPNQALHDGRGNLDERPRVSAGRCQISHMDEPEILDQWLEHLRDEVMNLVLDERVFWRVQEIIEQNTQRQIPSEYFQIRYSQQHASGGV